MQDFLSYADQTTLHPLAMVAIFVLGTAVLTVPRTYSVAPMLAMACFVSRAQRLVVGGLDFDILRIMIVFGAARVLIYGEYRNLRFKPIDHAVGLWAFGKFIIFNLANGGSSSAMVFSLGQIFETYGAYILFRCLIVDWKDVCNVGFALLILSVPVSLALMWEKSTTRNLFAIFGGVAEFSQLREGKLRAQGAFAHPLIAGCFWTTLLPIAIGRAIVLRRWLGTAIGGAAALLIIWSCASSTPIAGLGVGMMGTAAFVLRRHMKTVRWVLFGGLFTLHIVMKAPVWHLISRIDIVGGSTGYHRYRLIDAAVNRFSEWAVLGTHGTSHWGWGLHDITNQYIREAVNGGLVGLVCFVMILFYAYVGIGGMLRSYPSRAGTLLAWTLGVSLLVHTISMIVVSYFAQMNTALFLTLACIGSLTPARSARRRARRRRAAVAIPAQVRMAR